MWKASFTSVLSVRKKPPLREYKHENLEDLLSSGLTIGVTGSSSYEGNFRSAESGAFKKAWNIMKDNEYSFVESRKEALQRMSKDADFSFFDSLTSMSGTPEYQSCKVSPIKQK